MVPRDGETMAPSRLPRKTGIPPFRSAHATEECGRPEIARSAVNVEGIVDSARGGGA